MRKAFEHYVFRNVRSRMVPNRTSLNRIIRLPTNRLLARVAGNASRHNLPDEISTCFTPLVPGAHLTRFADDWVVTCKSPAEARSVKETALKILKPRQCWRSESPVEQCLADTGLLLGRSSLLLKTLLLCGAARHVLPPVCADEFFDCTVSLIPCVINSAAF